MRKIIPIILILIGVVLTGMFWRATPVEAQAGVCVPATDPAGNPITDRTTCVNLSPPGAWTFTAINAPTDPNTPGTCTSRAGTKTTTIQANCVFPNTWAPGTSGSSTGVTTPGTAPSDTKTSNLEAALPKCDLVPSLNGTNVGACLVIVAYHIVISTLTFVLRITAGFFDYMAMLTLHSGIYASQFIHDIWVIVRDFANIFFILILLYAAIELILGIGHNPLRTVAAVIVIALLVNFSLFFTRVVIDASNVVGLLFYNRIDTSNGVDQPISKLGEKGISRSLVAEFNINEFFSSTTIDQAKSQTVAGVGIVRDDFLSNGMALALITIYAIVIGPLAYAFMIVGLSFLGRAVTLMFLMMVAPLAFVTYAVPGLKGQEFIGFDSWKKKLLSSAFMAAIFMFILYIVSEIIRANPFTGNVDKSQGIAATLIGIFVPAVVIIMLLLKGASYAKKASGAATDAILSGAKVVGGLALGGGALFAAGAGRATIGATSKYVQNDSARTRAFTFQDTTQKWSQGQYLGAITSAIKNIPKFVPAAAAVGVHRVGLGVKMKDADTAYSHKEHATHTLDAKMQQEYGHAYGKDAKFKDLKENEQKDVLDQVNLDELSKFIYNKQFKDLEAAEGRGIKDLANLGNRAIADDHGKTIGFGTSMNVVRDASGNQKFDASGNPIIGDKFKTAFFVDMSETNAAIGEFVQALRKGSYDVRNLPDMSAKSKGVVPGLAVGLPAYTAAAFRLFIKKGVGVEHYGTPQKDFFKDLKDTISDSLKGIKINMGSGGHGDDGKTKEVKSVGH